MKMNTTYTDAKNTDAVNAMYRDLYALRVLGGYRPQSWTTLNQSGLVAYASKVAL
jgi:hypothetical protein